MSVTAADLDSAGIYEVRAVIPPGYQTDDLAAVIAFTAQYPAVMPLLAEARPQIARYFPGADVWLCVTYDPEGTNGPELIAAVNPTRTPAEAVEQYQQFLDAWWINAVGGTERLHFMPLYR